MSRIVSRRTRETAAPRRADDSHTHTEDGLPLRSAGPDVVLDACSPGGSTRDTGTPRDPAATATGWGGALATVGPDAGSCAVREVDDRHDACGVSPGDRDQRGARPPGPISLSGKPLPPLSARRRTTGSA